MMEEAVKRSNAKKAAPMREKVDPMRRVQIKLFKDNEKYSEPMYVSVNDYNAYIPRGVWVSVPYYVKLHIDEMQAQSEHAAAVIGNYESQYEKNRNKLE